MKEIFTAVLSMSLSGALLALLIIGARAIIGRRPGPFLPVLYALLMLRLMLPFSVPSPLSAMNLLPVPPVNTPTATVQTVGPPSEPPSPVAPVPDTDAADTVAFTGKPDIMTPPAENTGAAPAPVAAAMEPLEIAAVVWLAGAALAAAVLIAGNVRFLRLLKRRQAYDAPSFMALLDECKALLGLRRKLPAIQAQGVSAAAVYGVIRPRLLISPESFTPLSPAQQRHVLLHELSHIRRGDTAVCFLAAVLSVLHWFNPLVWLAFALMRRDIEVLCDDSVIKALGEHERPGYAATLLALAAPPQSPRMVTALFISHRCVKQRILAAARRKKASVLYSAAALLLTVLIAVTGCTAAMADTAKTVNPPNPASATPVVTPEATSPESDETETPRLIAAASYGIPEDVMQSDAVIANIDKAIALINGRKLSRDESFSLMNALGSLTADQGWQIAPSPGWLYLTDEQSAAQDDTSDKRTAQTGGGVEMLAAALHSAASIAGMDVRLIEGGKVLSAGDLMITNTLDGDFYLGVSRTDNMIAVSLSVTGQVAPAHSLALSPGQTAVLITAFTLDIRQHADTARVANIKKAAESLDGVTLEPGGQLSLNEVLGPRTTAEGWKKAPGIIEGTYVSFAGAGLDMVATALYNAALRAGLTIVESKPHTIPADYVDGGLDVTISSSGPDLKISNPHDAEVKFSVSYSNNQLMASVWGPQLPYTLDFHSESVNMTAEPETIYHYNATTTPDGEPIAPGDSVIYVSPRAGQTFRVYKTTKDLSGAVLKTELFSEVTYAAIPGHAYVNEPDPSESN
ncbi:MAG: hypothetical protein GXW96_07520 [Christensenellaceae bacterium]|nr:hypothetical protein [Christensenellaceae bacterium]